MIIPALTRRVIQSFEAALGGFLKRGFFALSASRFGLGKSLQALPS
ncbi:hypothetical protein ABI_10040 [Asticcacaulis biprosthecium C19]|uniref:Uncharacterized protein n=1 Tax=Asticcacaulis biprosthecium C19 TaxID=715226 RepID=F4QH30_9CAUL|nr:hypothetical protein ABI_10040 [Asticcacaulis biprosthecium C19]